MKKMLCLFFVALALVSCNSGEKKDAAKEKVTVPDGAIPIEYQGHIYLYGKANGIKGAFLFDTGASNFYFDSLFFKENDFKYKQIAQGYLPGAGLKLQKVDIVLDTVDFIFGNQEYKTTMVPVLILKPIVGDFADGILGMDYFSDKILQLDYDDKFMFVQHWLDSVMIAEYKPIKMRRSGGKLLFPLSVQINDSLNIQGDFLFDVGCGTSVVLTNQTAEKYDLNGQIKEKIKHFSKYGGIGGESVSYDFKAHSLSISDFKFNDVVMDYSIDKSGALAASEYIGIIGNEVFERFDMIIDFSNETLYLKPNSNFEKPFLFSRLGFSYVDRFKTMKAWIVTGLYENSPAHNQGLKIDDKIIAVNKIPVSNLDFKSRKSFLDGLSDIELTVKRGSKEMSFRFPLTEPF